MKLRLRSLFGTYIIKGIKKGKEELLKMAIIEKVIDDIPELISVDLLDIYSKLQITI
jgi:hypothetical protein